MISFSSCGTQTVRTTSADRVLELVLRYEKGNGSSLRRGYYLSVNPVSIRHYDNGLVMKEYEVHSGRTFFVHGCTRQSGRAEAEACALVNADMSDGLYDRHVRAVCEKAGFAPVGEFQGLISAEG